MEILSTFFSFVVRPHYYVVSLLWQRCLHYYVVQLDRISMIGVGAIISYVVSLLWQRCLYNYAVQLDTALLCGMYIEIGFVVFTTNCTCGFYHH